MLQDLRRLLARLFQRPLPGSDAFEDPYLGVRHPRKGGPQGRSSSVAVAEPAPDRDVRVVGRFKRPR